MIKIDLIKNISRHPNSLIVNVITAHQNNVFCKLSPYYMHGNIPVINTPNIKLRSVNEVWQQLYVKDKNMKDAKFKKGLWINEYWSYSEAREKILIPTYRWMLEEKAYGIIEFLRKEKSKRDIVIIDNSINCCIKDIEAPLSFAFLLKAYIEGTGPYKDSLKEVMIEKTLLVGRKYYSFKKVVIIPNKIANIYTGQQRRIDFEERYLSTRLE